MWVSVCVCVYCNLTWHRFLSLIFLEKNMNFNYHDRKSELINTETQCILDSYVITSSIQAISLSFWCQAGQRLIEFCQENVLVIRNTLFQQHKWRLYTWTSLDGQHQNQIDSILCSQRWRSSIQSAKTRPGADCGSDH